MKEEKQSDEWKSMTTTTMLELHDIDNVINARQYWSRIISPPSWACVAKCSLILETFGPWTNTGVETVEKRESGETEVFKDDNCDDSLNYYLILL